MMGSKPEIVVLDDAQAVTEEAAARWLALATEAIRKRGQFMVALSGGSTPRALYERLAQPPYVDDTAWTDTHVFWGDERTVPPTHADSNYRMAHEAFLARVPLPERNIHRPRAEERSEDAAVYYEHDLRRSFRLGAVGFPRFDLILLGMGGDGHTASLFPGNPALDDNVRLFMAPFIPQFDSHRLTMSGTLINHAAQVMFLVVGEGKADTLNEVLEGERDPHRLPAQLVAPEDGQVTWLVDKAAARLLSS